MISSSREEVVIQILGKKKEVANNPSSERRIPLIYVLGFGRSGSTLLDLLLGAHPDLLSTGEYTHFPKWLAEDDYCTCGERIRTCPLWGQVILRVPPYTTTEPITPASRGFRNLLPFIGAIFRRPNKPRLHTLAKKNYLLFREALKIAEKKVVVDSSKSFHRLVFLERSGLFDIRVVFLTRDGRGVAISKKEKKNKVKRLWNLEAKKPRSVFWTARNWTIHNFLDLVLCKTVFRERSTWLRYEDLAQDPVGTMRELMCRLSLPPHIQSAEIPGILYHNIAGNSSRLERDFRISLDERWKTEMTTVERGVFLAVGSVMLRIFGYPLFRNR